MTTQEAMKVLKDAINKDKEVGSYAYSWYCNLVMPVIDSGGSRKAAEEGAARVMYNAFDFIIPEDWRQT